VSGRVQTQNRLAAADAIHPQAGALDVEHHFARSR
jgi:hypothetical protein